MSTPILPFAMWPEGILQARFPANDNSLRSQILNGLVISDSTTVQPGSPNDGDIYIIPSGATGTQWATFTEDDLAIFNGGAWYAFAPSEGVVVNFDGEQKQWTTAGGWSSVAGGGGLSDGDKGDITVSGSGSVWTIDNQAVTYAKMQNISAQYRLLGRNSSGGGSAEEVSLSQLLDWVGSAANGDILYRASGVWTRLPVGTDGQVLTLASGLPSWAAGGGGGGLSYITEALNTASPNNTINAVSLSVTGGSTNADFVLRPKGDGAVQVQIADGTASGGNKRGAGAVDFQSIRNFNSQVASGNYSFSSGASNTASGSYSTAIGNNNTATADSSVSLGNTNNCSANYSFAIGNNNTVSASGAGAFGSNNTSNATNSLALGLRAHTRAVVGRVSHASGYFSAAGDSQYSRIVMRALTNSATPSKLTTNNSTAAATNQIVVPNSCSLAFDVQVVAQDDINNEAARWSIKGLARSNGGTVGLVGTPTVNQDFATTNATGWSIAVSANSATTAVELSVTGAASKTIKWVACAQCVEVFA